MYADMWKPQVMGYTDRIGQDVPGWSVILDTDLLDPNRDGTITADELRSFRELQKRAGGDPVLMAQMREEDVAALQ